MSYRKYWIALGAVMIVSFAVLGFFGYEGIKSAPPIPAQVVTTDGEVLFDGDYIMNGQNVWQSIGGQEIGSIWGHGAYVAPDWTADYLHRESVILLDLWARVSGAESFEALDVEQQGALRARLERAQRTNTYDPATGNITISPERARAFDLLARHYADVFGNGRPEYAIPRGALVDETKQRQMASFFFWTSWAAATNRPDAAVSYTQNWPHEPLVGNRPTTSAIIWSLVSIFALLAGVGGFIWYYASKESVHEELLEAPDNDPLLALKPTPSQLATLKFFFVVAALWILQIAFGAITAHYGVEGDGFFGLPLDQILPYSIARTWHLQLGIFWIATSWLAMGLFIAPAIAGHEPKGQRFGVNVLFGALVFVVFGSLAGQWLGIQQKLGDLWFWFGMQGYEYVELGRFWQILLFVGLCLWLVLMWRGIRPALARRDESRSLLLLFTVSAIAIPMFYAAGLMYGEKSPLVTAEYWRWWVVHLWVEGFFEVFATVVIAFLFVRLGLLGLRFATKAVLFSTILFLSGGIIGTFHHLYFTGMPDSVLALGSVFSALEIVPLVLIGFEAWSNLRIARRGSVTRWLGAYKWPIYFFVAVAFWNLVGAGLFGFLINPPVALYYMQGLNTTPVHGHTALFGVYGMLGIGLMLFALKALRPQGLWSDKAMSIGFWSLNIGLVTMVAFSMLPIGLLQVEAAVSVGTWYARSAEFLQTPLMQNLRWLRGIGDSIFAIGALAIAWTVFNAIFRKAKGDAVPVHDAIALGPVAPAPAGMMREAEAEV